MKKLLLACTYIVVSVCTSNALALTYKEITNLENPFDTDEEFEDEYAPKVIRLKAEKERFDVCQRDLDIALMVSSRKRVAVSSGEPLDEHSLKKSWARHIGLEYPYISSQSDSSSLARRLAIETGWDVPSANDREVNVFANIYWNKCMALPIEAFEVWYRKDAGD